ncbi:recombinase [Anaerotignum neopropionicum]|uniref:Recombinase n=1 Tax=Anaerotignum neopropionicum TaxID=36847 RepID=A0A136WD97_9FIRM|nr:recombinase family protein [Anaerotignum neopropionicum]KXL52492.1 recombinase [Anaerotignum neopropionicum]
MDFEGKPMVYQAAIYLRLSREDGDKFESNSIKNQRDLIKFYLRDKADISVVSEKIDDGYSGVSFDRPALKELLEEIKNRKINCIIVKDLSRFGRNYIEVGRYIEQIFPFLGTRFIAINDHIDTACDSAQADSILIPFKNLMNDAYSRDISIKSRSQLMIRHRCGDFVGAFPVYGYSRSKEDKHKLVVDEEAGQTIKEIFSLRIAGYNNAYIANHLNQLGVPSPMENKKLQNSNFSTSFKLNPRAKWSPMAVDRILKNEIYTGVMLQGKETTWNYKIKKRIKKPKADWVRVENTHSAIIPREDFEIIQRIMQEDTRTSPKMKKLYMFSGLLQCGSCGSNMVRKNVKARGNVYTYYICSKNKEDKKECSSHRIRETVIEDAVLALLKKQVEIFCQFDEENEKDFFAEKQKEKQKIEKQIQTKKYELKKYEELKRALNGDHQEGVLSKADYDDIKAGCEKICADIRENIKALYLKKQKILKKNDCNVYWFHEFLKSQTELKLNRTFLAFLIDKIIIFQKNKIKIKLKFDDEFEKAMKRQFDSSLQEE